MLILLSYRYRMSSYYRYDVPTWRFVSLRTYTYTYPYIYTASPREGEAAASIEDTGDIGACG
jgi:hypothetical protein